LVAFWIVKVERAPLDLFSASAVMATGYELTVIAVVVIGRTSLKGGEGMLFGSLTGALFFAVIDSALNILNVAAYWQYVVTGVFLISALGVQALRGYFTRQSVRKPGGGKEKNMVIEAIGRRLQPGVIGGGPGSVLYADVGHVVPGRKVDDAPVPGKPEAVGTGLNGATAAP
jgi:hypothetical protein